MRKKISVVPFSAVLAICTLFVSCNKINQVDWGKFDHTPPGKSCDVLEYESPYWDNSYFPLLQFPHLFKKTYDAAGNLVAIDCSFNNTVSQTAVTEYNLLVKQNGLTIYLVNKNNPTDTTMNIKLGNNGRPLSFQGNFPLTYDNYQTLQSGNFTYKNNRLFAGTFSKYTPGSNYPAPVINDTFRYDTKGNLLSHWIDTYQYDYSKVAKQQFYADDEDMSSLCSGFYLLQYLNFFPEITNPVNVRVSFTSEGYGVVNLINHKFDNDGNLISYQYNLSAESLYNTDTATIAWNCK
jgi:hypothetical protein